jgi:hypothetical protein
MQHSEWATPTTEEIKELEYTQLEENNENGKGNGNSVPINGGMWIVLFAVIIFGLWKQYRISRHSISAY